MNSKNILVVLLISTLSFIACNNESGMAKSTSPHKTEQLNWLSMNDIEGALKSDPKPVLIDVYTKWCGPCKLLDKNTFSDPQIQKLFADNFHIVKFDAEEKGDITFNGKTHSNPKYKEGKRGRNSQNQLSPFFKVRGYPTIAIMDKNLKIVDRIVGYKTPEQLTLALEKHIIK